MKTPDRSKEELILGAAMEVFIEKGRSGARMQEIADRAGISKTLLHYYFRSKENIYSRILESVFTLFFSQLEQALLNETSIEPVLRHFIDTITDRLSENPKVPLFMLHELSQGGATVREILESKLKAGPFSLPHRLFTLMAQEQAAGRIRAVNPVQFMLTLIGACFYYFMAEPVFSGMYRSLYPEGSFDRAAFIAERKKAVFDLIFYGLKAGRTEAG